MIGIYTTGKIPFKHVYLTGLVLDENGQKMSKSKGNVINPIKAISEFGSDALRLGLIANRSAGQNQAFSLDRVQAGRNFCNKLWNIARFAEGKIVEGYRVHEPEPKTIADHWIIGQLSNAITDIGQKVESYRFAEASDAMYHTVWDDVADWYIESSKLQDNSAMLAWVLDACLKIAHPFAPFVTETIWQTLPWHDTILMSTAWPKASKYDDIAAAEFNQLMKLVTEIRFVTNELPGNNRHVMLYQNDSLIADNIELIKKLAKLKDIQAVDQPRGLRLATSGQEAWLDISTKTLHDHQTNLKNRLADTDAQIAALEARLSNKAYTSKAPANLVEESRTQLDQKKTLKERLIHELEIIK